MWCPVGGQDLGDRSRISLPGNSPCVIFVRPSDTPKRKGAAMAKAKKPTAKSPAKKKGSAKPGKDLSPEELENVAGGLAPPPPGIVGGSAIKWAPAQKV